MFDRVVVRRATDVTSNQPIDLGALAEAILFYDKTNLLVNRGGLKQLLNVCGPETTLHLIEEGYVSVRYAFQNIGVHSESQSDGRKRHLPAVFSVGTSQDEEVFDIWRQCTGKSRASRRQADRFMELAPPFELPPSFSEDVKSAMLDEHFLESAARITLSSLAPSYQIPTGFYFRPIAEPDGRLRVATNLNEADAGVAYRKVRGDDAGDITTAQILSEVVEMHAELFTGAEFESDSLASELSAKLIAIGGERLGATQDGRARILSFSEVAMEGRSIREAINSGRRSIDEFIPILDRSRNFRDWIRGLPPESDLIRAYFEECTKDSWVSSLPSRGFRWAITSLIPFSMATSIPLSILDAFVLDRLGNGWRPNQFVNRKVMPFVRPPT